MLKARETGDIIHAVALAPNCRYSIGSRLGGILRGRSLWEI